MIEYIILYEVKGKENIYAVSDTAYPIPRATQYPTVKGELVAPGQALLTAPTLGIYVFVCVLSVFSRVFLFF